MQKPIECFQSYQGDNGCQLAEVGRGFSRPDGKFRRKVVMIGESLGYEEMRDGLPFRPKAQAGSKLEECIKLAGYERDDFLLWNICACQPPGNELEGREDAIIHCKVHFDRVLNSIPNRSKTILALGSKPSRTLYSGYAGVLEWRGFVLPATRKVEKWNGFWFEETGEVTKYGYFLGSFHPSFIKRGAPELTPLLAFDIQRAVEVAEEKFTNFPGGSGYVEPRIHEFPSLDDAWSFYYLCKSNPKLVITFDIETPKTGHVTEEERADIEDAPIFQIQFSVNTREAIVFPWKQPFLAVITALFLLENVKANHFAYGFDIPKLKAAGVKIAGKCHDTMWMFKHWQPRLPRGLQNVASMAGYPYPWKQEFEDRPQWYGGNDVIAVHYILRWLMPLMKKLGVWQGYLDEVFHEYYILQGASDRGTPINDKARVELLGILRGEAAAISKELQTLVPDELKVVEPKRKQKNGAIDYGYKNPPRKLLVLAQESYAKWPSRESYDFETYLDKFCIFRTKPTKTGKYKQFRLRKKRFQGINGETGELMHEERYYREIFFITSSQQLIGYMNWKREELLSGTQERS